MEPNISQMGSGAVKKEDLVLARRDFLMEVGNCAICGRQATDTHEITRGPGRKAGCRNRAAWLALCRVCHEQVGDYAVWPVATQYALKALRDGRYYDRKLLNVLRGRADSAIDELDVILAAYRLGKRHG